MGVFFQIALLMLYVTASDSSIYDKVSGTISQYLKSSLKNFKSALEEESNPGVRFQVKNNEKSYVRNDQKSNERNDQKSNERNDQKSNERNDQNSNERNDQATVKRHIPKLSINFNRPVTAEHQLVNSSPKTIIRIFKSGGKFRKSDYRYPRNGELLRIPKDVMITGNSPNSITDKGKEQPYRLDPVLNSFRRSPKVARRGASASTDTDSESSSMEMREWKNEWKELWLKKKLEALNQTHQQGDVVNMVAARPWGVPCGDPKQHDMPWGTCMLSMECEPEYRIYRGDFQCGRTKFICCAIQLTNYDMYQGFDASFADSALTSDSEEKRNRDKNSSERRRRKKEKDKKRRRKARKKRKKKIKKNIKKIIREIKKILNKQYRNGTTQRKKRTKQLKKFVKDLKKKYRMDRKTVKNVHEIELVKIDARLLKKINEIKNLNRNFVSNATFREIIRNRAIDRKGARMLVEAYPELMPYFTDNTRRTGGADQQAPKDYDIEYGMLYY